MEKLKISFLSLITISCFSCNSTISKKEKKKAEKKFDYANSFIQGSDMEQFYYDELVKEYPSYSHVWFEKAVWPLKTGNYIQMMEFLDKALELDPEVYLDYSIMTKTYFLRDYDGAKKDIERLVSYTDGNQYYSVWGYPLLLYLGKIAFLEKKYTEALGYFNKYIDNAIKESKKDWVDTTVYLLKGISKIELGLFSEAISSLDKAIELAPKSSDFTYYKGIALAKMGKTEKACILLNQSLLNFDAGYYRKDSYREVVAQIFRSDFERAMVEFCQ